MALNCFYSSPGHQILIIIIIILFYFPLLGSLKLNNQYMLKEDFICKRYIYLTLVNVQILINFLIVLITRYYI